MKKLALKVDQQKLYDALSAGGVRPGVQQPNIAGLGQLVSRLMLGEEGTGDPDLFKALEAHGVHVEEF